MEKKQDLPAPPENHIWVKHPKGWRLHALKQNSDEARKLPIPKWKELKMLNGDVNKAEPEKKKPTPGKKTEKPGIKKPMNNPKKEKEKTEPVEVKKPIPELTKQEEPTEPVKQEIPVPGKTPQIQKQEPEPQKTQLQKVNFNSIREIETGQVLVDSKTNNHYAISHFDVIHVFVCMINTFDSDQKTTYKIKYDDLKNKVKEKQLIPKNFENRALEFEISLSLKHKNVLIAEQERQLKAIEETEIKAHKKKTKQVVKQLRKQESKIMKQLSREKIKQKRINNDIERQKPEIDAQNQRLRILKNKNKWL